MDEEIVEVANQGRRSNRIIENSQERKNPK